MAILRSSRWCGPSVGLRVSWYEGINLEQLRTQQEGSPWITDPAKIALRQDTADYMARYSQPHHIVKGDTYIDDEDYENSAVVEDVESDEEKTVDPDAESEVPETFKKLPRQLRKPR